MNRKNEKKTGHTVFFIVFHSHTLKVCVLWN